MSKARGILIAGNWKMNQSQKETEKFFSALQDLADPFLQKSQSASSFKQAFDSTRLQACLIPSFFCLEKARTLAHLFPFPISIAAQNAHWEKKGAFTGEISGPMLQELGISWALVGHSERRQYFGETDQTVHLRAASLLGQGFQVILCVGETRQEREESKTHEVLTRQVRQALGTKAAGLCAFLTGQLVFAYEPVWAIGTGLTATPAQAEEAHQIIRNLITEQMGNSAAEKTPLLYGGSVTPENIDSILACPNVDGALVGGASLKPESFFALLQAGARAVS